MFSGTHSIRYTSDSFGSTASEAGTGSGSASSAHPLSSPATPTVAVSIAAARRLVAAGEMVRGRVVIGISFYRVLGDCSTVSRAVRTTVTPTSQLDHNE